FDDDGGSIATSFEGGVAIATDLGATYIAHAIDGGVAVTRMLDGGVADLDQAKACRSLVLGSSALYLADHVKNQIRKIPFQGSPSVIASPNGAPNDLAIDSTQLYFTVNGSPSQVHRISQ